MSFQNISGTKDGIGALFSKHLNECGVIAVMEIRDKGKP